MHKALLGAGYLWIEYDGLGTDIYRRQTTTSDIMAQLYNGAVVLYDWDTRTYERRGTIHSPQDVWAVTLAAEATQEGA